MKIKKKSKKCKLFRKIINKTRKTGNRFHIGGLDSEKTSSRSINKTPRVLSLRSNSSSKNSPRNTSPPTGSPPTASPRNRSPLIGSPKKELFKNSPPRHSPLKTLHSEKTYDKIKSKPSPIIPDAKLYPSISSISHEQADNPKNNTPPPPPLPVDLGDKIRSYNLSSKSSPGASKYNPPKSVINEITYLLDPADPNSITNEYFSIPDPANPSKDITIPQYTLVPQPEPAEPMPLTVKTGSIDKLLPRREHHILQDLKYYHMAYWNLAPNLYLIMRRINILPLFGNALVWGDLHDGLIDCIGLSSEKAIESRLLYTNKTHIKLFIEACKNFYGNLGASVNNPTQGIAPGIDTMSPNTTLHTADPQSFQVLGYNKHPFFNPPLITHNMYVEGMKKRQGLRNEYVFIECHGGLGRELSQEKKILAKKYIRLIEFGSTYESVTVPYKLFKKVNDLMRQPKYNILFHNNEEGANLRKKTFSDLCKYYSISEMSACETKNTFSLVDITHDRELEGHFPDSETVDNHKITFQTMRSMYTMGMLVPLDYNKDKSQKFLYKKEMFKLYPGSNFFTNSTKFNLIDTILPIAIKENKIFNILLFSCAVRYQDESPYVPPLPGMKYLPVKKQDIIPHMDILHKGKKYISNFSRLLVEISGYIYQNKVAPHVSITNLYESNGSSILNKASIMQPGDIYTFVMFLHNLKSFYARKGSYFIDYPEKIMSSLFSFNEYPQTVFPYYLIDADKNIDINTEETRNLIMVKTYLIKEFYDKCYKQFLKIWRVIHVLFIELSNIKPLLTERTHIYAYDTNFPLLTEIHDYLQEVNKILKFCNKGLQKKPGPESFYSYPKFVEVVEEYKKKRVSQLYDKLFPEMDFDVYNPKRTIMKDLPTGWITEKDNSSGLTYYVDTNHGVSYWNKPLIPPGWSEEIDSKGKPYYVKDETGEVSYVLPDVDKVYPYDMYLEDKMAVVNKAPNYRKQRKYIYKYDELDNIDNAKSRIKTHKRKTDIKAGLLSSARRRGQTVKNKQILDLKKMAELKKNPLIRDRFLEEADKINDKVRNEMYHVSV
jgi:hypothetical protein